MVCLPAVAECPKEQSKGTENTGEGVFPIMRAKTAHRPSLDRQQLLPGDRG